MDLNQSSGFLINQLAHLMKVELDQRLAKYQVTTSQWAVLALLWKTEGLSQVEIQQAFHIEKATVAGLIQRMIRLGLLYKKIDAADKRVHRVYLTEKGKSLEQQLVVEAQAVNEQMLQGFSNVQREQFFEIMKLALSNMRR